MTDRVTISYDGSNTIDVMPGRALRLSGETYPLFRPPDPASVADPGDCIDFLKTLHLSLCPVFNIRLRRWMERYFGAVLVQVDARAESLAPIAGLDPAVSHRAWSYGAYRPLSNASFELDGVRHDVPVLLWCADGPLAIRFEVGGNTGGIRTVIFGDAELAASGGEFLGQLGDDVAEFWHHVAAPRHPFVRSALAGLRG